MRYLAFDMGSKRTGVAVTDPLGMFAQALTTLETPKVLPWLKNYLEQEKVKGLVLGFPLNHQGEATDATALVLDTQKKIQSTFPNLPIFLEDEAFSSKQALNTLIQAGTSPKKRREKGLIDKVSAVHILQRFLQNQTTAL